MDIEGDADKFRFWLPAVCHYSETQPTMPEAPFDTTRRVPETFV